MKIVRLPKKIILLLFFPLALLLSAKSALAYYTREDYNKAFTESVFVEPGINQPSFTWESTQALTASLNTMILGCTSQNCPEEVRGTGAVNGVSNLIASMYANPPASGIQYLADLGKNLGLVSPAYAAVGTGFSGLSPILPIWKAFRNIAYLFFTIVFIAIGFAIMFRVKISPQAVVTIQSALPRMIIALILVTFSYAIAGFLIDLMYVVILLGIAVLGPIAGGKGLETIYTGGFDRIIGEAFGVAGAGISGGIWVVMTGLGALVGGIIGGMISFNPALIAIGIIVGGGLFALIIAIIILFVLFKLLIELIKAYISILLLIIFAPLQIMLGVIPGQSGFGNWFRSLVANVAVFPAVALFFLLAKIMTGLEAGKLWTPPMTVGADLVVALIGLGMLLLASKVPEIVKNALQVKPFPYGAAIGEAMGPARMAGRVGFFYGAGEAASWLEGPPGAPASWRQTAAGVVRRVTGVRRP